MLPVERIWLGVQLLSPKRNAVDSPGEARARMAHTALTVSLAISPTRSRQKSPPEDDHEELGEIDAHHALESALDGRTGAKSFFFIK